MLPECRALSLLYVGVEEVAALIIAMTPGVAPNAMTVMAIMTGGVLRR
ncbi:hypothetical protein QN360_15870 [Glaciimonas sp. CA11.2]|nr:hypothetical protein [Glaciimonas sp. CA11.2]MDY7546948.1 hypothetical protein [Glaciimonas sp. CA11.2]MEB0164371.1 hypothetical protein [Glaciimonas sp. CA11.2]